MDHPEHRGHPPARGGSLWLHPDDDLAPNRPGETLHGRVAALPAGRLRAARDRLLRRSADADALRAALRAQQRAGAVLDGFGPAGWRVLHSVPLPGGADLPHLAIGPGGVFAIRSVPLDGTRVAVDEDFVRVDGRRAEPHVRLSRRAATRAAHALGRARGHPVGVRAVLVCVAAVRITVGEQPRDVDVLDEVALAGLCGRGGVLTPAGVEALHSAARDRGTWRYA
ncbi:nuclease-related domain-containing protein [Streptomyces marincola]|uniref:NERD domain-containing protein n=1 Tax=Streptomyces marincola TaxID=2878388 RepID=A0A1W7D4I7_9ACTN|nr:nuclease-related domain-containing protein [Streptomyces marincola]ARQ71915.1 hypothetical protein CAG99_26535 [Streptomyces marincola]